MVMRKMMTKCLEEVMRENRGLVYLGEDVEHGGYYLVTDGLAKKFPGRVIDMPPDETSLLGIGWGIAQYSNINSNSNSGGPLVVVVEIPYAKYLDCGADMLHEIVTSNWLTHANRNRDSNDSDDNHSKCVDNNDSSNGGSGSGRGSGCVGLVIRLQGFDRGVFGGNFHTHNALPLPPGLDVVVHSNGADWCRGFRHAVSAAKQGRVVLVVDSTDLLNRRHLNPEAKDGAMTLPYPTQTTHSRSEATAMLGFDAVLRHGHGIASPRFAPKPPPPLSLGTKDTGRDAAAAAASAATFAQGGGRGGGGVVEEWDDLTIVTYGTGVVAARNAQRSSEPQGYSVGVVEVPCVSAVPQGLAHALSRSRTVLFADPCKLSQAPLLHFTATLQKQGVLGRQTTTTTETARERAEAGGAADISKQGNTETATWWRDWAVVAAQSTYNPLGSTVTFLSEADILEASLRLLEGAHTDDAAVIGK
mmetsp:Transcript_57551/g.115552  ORF Transcript_57551/g.115552 Transcript_57551/m.115552 type:complete len:473 (-) Transcript_57551:149-1567(-)